MSDVTILRADRWVDVVAGEVRSPAVVVVDGNQIVGVNPTGLPAATTEVDLGDVTLLPGLMDMELNMLIGGPGGPDGLPDPMHGVKDSPVYRTLRGAVNCATTLMAGFTTVRNLGLMVYTAGFLLDVDLARAVDMGWFPGPRIIPAGHAITPTGGHLDPTMFQGLAPGIMPQSVEQGIANGVSEVRKAAAVPDQVRRQADQDLGVGRCDVVLPARPGCQQYSDEELAAIVDEAHRNGLRVPHTPTGTPASGPASRPGSTASSTVHWPPTTRCGSWPRPERSWWAPPPWLTIWRVDRIHPILQKKAAEIFPQARPVFGQAPRRRGQDRMWVRRAGHPPRDPGQRADRHGRPRHDADAGTAGGHGHRRRAHRARSRPEGAWPPGYLADVVAVPGDPSEDITGDQRRVLRHERRSHLQRGLRPGGHDADDTDHTDDTDDTVGDDGDKLRAAFYAMRRAMLGPAYVDAQTRTPIRRMREFSDYLTSMAWVSGPGMAP